MKTTQYVRIEKAIAAAAKSDIRDRWLWGLRVVNDSDLFAPGSTQLKPGRTDELIRAAKAAGLTLSEREIRYRIQCARAYPYESQIRHAGAEFEDQLTLFPLDRYEPAVATVKELQDYAITMTELTARFAARDQERALYVARLVDAADGDLTVTWGVAHERAFGGDVAA